MLVCSEQHQHARICGERGHGSDGKAQGEFHRGRVPPIIESEPQGFFGVHVVLQVLYGFARMAGSLHAITGMTGDIVCGDDQEEAFRALKEVVTMAPVLAQPVVGR